MIEILEMLGLDIKLGLVIGKTILLGIAFALPFYSALILIYCVTDFVKKVRSIVVIEFDDYIFLIFSIVVNLIGALLSYEIIRYVG